MPDNRLRIIHGPLGKNRKGQAMPSSPTPMTQNADIFDAWAEQTRTIAELIEWQRVARAAMEAKTIQCETAERRLREVTAERDGAVKALRPFAKTILKHDKGPICDDDLIVCPAVKLGDLRLAARIVNHII